MHIYRAAKPFHLRAYYNTPCPQAVSADRKGVAETILLVGFGEFAPATVHAWRKLEPLHPIAELFEFIRIPDFEDTLFRYVAQRVSSDLLFPSQDIAGIGMHQRDAWAYGSIPSDAHGSFLNKRAARGCTFPVTRHGIHNAIVPK